MQGSTFGGRWLTFGRPGASRPFGRPRGPSAASRPIACYRWLRDGGSAYLLRSFSGKMARRGQTLLNGGFAMASVPGRGPQERPPGPFQGPTSKGLRFYLQRNCSYLQRRHPHWFICNAADKNSGPSVVANNALSLQIARSVPERSIAFRERPEGQTPFKTGNLWFHFCVGAFLSVP